MANNEKWSTLSEVLLEDVVGGSVEVLIGDPVADGCALLPIPGPPEVCG